jgi:predicted MFS family arabinose efflux permease
LAGVLATHGYVWIFVGDAITCWAAAVMLLVTISPKRSANDVEHEKEVSSGGSPWRDPPFLAFMLLLMVLGMAFLQVWSTMPLYLRSFFEMSERAIGLLLALNALLIVLAEMLLIRAVEHRDRMRMVGLGALLVCGGLALLAAGTWWPIAVLAMVVLTAGEMLSMPITNAVVADRAGTGLVGQYMGVYTLAFSTAFVIGPIVGTAVYQNLGPRMLWLGVGALGVFLAVAFASLSRPLRNPR